MPRARVIAAVVAPIVVFLAFAVPLWVMEFDRGRGAFDQLHFHHRVVEAFAKQWPKLDFKDYASATSPGYHVILAGVSKAIGTHAMVLQVVASVFTLALLGGFGAVLARRGATAYAWVLALPLACSMYVVYPGVWLQPDNAGWLGVMLVLVLCGFGRIDVPRLTLAGLVLAALVFTRQSHIWAAGLIWAAGWLGGARSSDGAIASLVSDRARRTRGLMIAVLASVPGVMVLGYLVRQWGGLVPPSFVKQSAFGANFATPAFVLSLIAIYSCFLIAFMREGLERLWREAKWAIAIAALVGVIAALVPTTTYLYEARASGLWNIVRAMESRGIVLFGRTSPLLLVLAPLGAVFTLAWLAQTPGRQRWIFAAAIVGFTAAQTANSLCWQRYIEPLLLIVLGLMASLAPERALARDAIDRNQRVIRIAGVLGLAALLLALTIQSLLSAEPI